MNPRTRKILLSFAVLGGIWLLWPQSERTQPERTRTSGNPRTPRHSATRERPSSTGGANHRARQSPTPAEASAETSVEELAAHRRPATPGIHARRDRAFLQSSHHSKRGAARRPSPSRQQLRRLRLGAPAAGNGPGLSLAQALGSSAGSGAGPSTITRSTSPAENTPSNTAPDIHQRIAAIREAAAEGFDEAEIDLAYDFLEDEANGLSGDAYHWLVDELLIGLRNQQELPSGIATRLASIAADPGQDPVVRDYALQHLGHLHQQGGSDVAIAEAALWQAVEGEHSDFTGSALIALSHAAEDGRLQGEVDFAEVSIGIAADPGHTTGTRSTALSLAGSHGAAAHLPTLVQLAADPANPTLIRLGALSAMAGSEGGLPLIEQHLNNPEARLRQAASSLLAQHKR